MMTWLSSSPWLVKEIAVMRLGSGLRRERPVIPSKRGISAAQRPTISWPGGAHHGGSRTNEMAGVQVKLTNLRDSNERYIAANFGKSSFAILMSVKVVQNKASTPDFSGGRDVLYQWRQPSDR
jgi:hypothetical protein